MNTLTVSEIVKGLEPAQAKEFCLFVSAYWNGKPDSLERWIDRALVLIGVNSYTLNSELAKGIHAAMKQKAVPAELRYKQSK